MSCCHICVQTNKNQFQICQSGLTKLILTLFSTPYYPSVKSKPKISVAASSLLGNQNPSWYPYTLKPFRRRIALRKEARNHRFTRWLFKISLILKLKHARRPSTSTAVATYYLINWKVGFSRQNAHLQSTGVRFLRGNRLANESNRTGLIDLVVSKYCRMVQPISPTRHSFQVRLEKKDHERVRYQDAAQNAGFDPQMRPKLLQPNLPKLLPLKKSDLNECGFLKFH